MGIYRRHYVILQLSVSSCLCQIEHCQLFTFEKFSQGLIEGISPWFISHQHNQFGV